MARGINKVILVGNLGREPEVRYMANGNPVVTLALATSESWRDKTSGENVERTEWHRVVYFNRLAEIAGQYLRKGSKIYVEGSLRTRKWQDNNGQDRYTTEIVGNEMQMLDSRGGEMPADMAMGEEPAFDDMDNTQGAAPENTKSKKADKKAAEPVAEALDDDIPF